MAIVVDPERMVEFASVAKDLTISIWKRTNKIEGAILALIEENGDLKFVDTTQEAALIDAINDLMKKEIACVISIFEADMVEDELVDKKENERLVRLKKVRKVITLVSGQCFLFAYSSRIKDRNSPLENFISINPFDIPLMNRNLQFF